ncbi:MAG TPA: 16S rRNA (guanine(527)-N(7))-methyltransferase RsmG [Acetobacteraceae bacterium]|nr:16S rRNA (guanine(527)-N(7))-methyltransferase RsmG [Acetobacteraceae bacterium]
MKRRSASNDFVEFEDLLRRWNGTINLIAAKDERSIRQRHIEDSLQLVPLIPPGTERAIDLGSGAGFPGLILAAATGISVELIEPDHRKAAFLREATRLLGASAQVHVARAEDVRLKPAVLVTARALARLPRLLQLAAPLLASDGTCLFLKGATVESELTDASVQWHMRVERIPSRTAPGAVILRITELQRVKHQA